MLLLIAKVFHWILKERVDNFDQMVSPSSKKIFSLLSACIIFTVFDYSATKQAVAEVSARGPSIAILFGAEYAILSVFLIQTIGRIFICLKDHSDREGWSEKTTAVFYLETATDAMKLAIYVVFFFLVTKYYGLPVHILRDLYLTIRSFISRINDVVSYRRSIQNLRRRCPDASLEELEKIDRTCIICRDEMKAAKKLACGHFFHFLCLKTWIERHQSCPTCRRDIFLKEAPGSSALAPADSTSTAAATSTEEQPQMATTEPQDDCLSPVFSVPADAIPIVLLQNGEVGVWKDESLIHTMRAMRSLECMEQKLEAMLSEIRLLRGHLQQSSQIE